MPLIDALSPARFSTYLAWACGDEPTASQLYAYNIRLASALYGPLHMLEVTLRNSIDGQFQKIYGANWLCGTSVGLSRYQVECISKAKQTLARQGKPAPHDTMVAELNFGFWVSFLGKQSYTQWQHLRPMFKAPKLQRAQIAGSLDQLRDLRNRIAHYEPILSLPLDERYLSIIELIGWMQPDAAAWIVQTSDWQRVFLGSPTFEKEVTTNTLQLTSSVAHALAMQAARSSSSW